jgi:uncharacterized membrane protein YGL010W
MTFEELLEQYDQDHRHPANRLLHLVGITLIGSSVVVVFVVPPLGAVLFGLGWSAQFLGHAIEGKPPSFTRDLRYMAVGASWYVRELRGLFSRALRA